MMTLDQRIDSLAQLGQYLLEDQELTQAFITRATFENPWFTKENIEFSLKNIAQQFLNKDKLNAWIHNYPASTKPQNVGLIMAGNIPLVGFHDLLCVLISGHHAIIKMSDKDKVMIPHLTSRLIDFQPLWKEAIHYVDKLEGFDAMIATGSNNSARYFETYFSKYPHIIRKNRNSIAVLTGQETKEDIMSLGQDIFMYFGLGCRNVSKIYFPKGYELTPFLEILHNYKAIIQHSKYKNNFDYNFALHSINNDPIHINGCLIMREDESIHSRIATLHYEFYDDIQEVTNKLNLQKDQIQVVLSNKKIEGFPLNRLGDGQSPQLNDYPDGVDVMAFLSKL